MRTIVVENEPPIGQRILRFFSGGLALRLLLFGLMVPCFFFFSDTLPAISTAMNNGQTPRVLSWSEVEKNHIDLKHSYVQVSGVLTAAVVTETRGSDISPTNSYEILYDPATRAALLIRHRGERSSLLPHDDDAPVTVTGVLREQDDDVTSQIPDLQSVDLNRSVQLDEDVSPGDLAALITTAVVEIICFGAAVALGIYYYRNLPQRSAVPAAITAENRPE